MISTFSFFLSLRQKSQRERTSASTTGSGKWDQSNERQMPPISNTWTRMIPLVHVDCCAALMAQHLQFNRGSSEHHMDAYNPQRAFVMSLVHAVLIIAHLKGTSQHEKQLFSRGR